MPFSLGTLVNLNFWRGLLELLVIVAFFISWYWQTKNRSLDKTIKLFQQEAEGYRGLMDLKEQEIANERKDLTRQVSSLKAEIEELRGKLTELTAERTDFARIISSLELRNRKLTDENIRLKGELAKLKANGSAGTQRRRKADTN